MIKQSLCTLFIASCFILVSCSGELDSEAQIHTFISTAKKEAENRDLRGIKKLISENYSDRRQHTKKEVLQIVGAYFMRNRNINLLTRIESLQFAETKTSASLTVYAAVSKTAHQDDDIQLLQAKVHRFDIVLQNDSGDWLLSSAEWRKGTIDEFLIK